MMKALYFDGQLKYSTQAPMPVPDQGEALVRVRLAGICNTDLEIVKGYMGFAGIPGHEFVGTVESSGDPALEGRRVVGEINCPCRGCPACEAGLSNHCPGRTVLGMSGRNGAFAEYLTLPADNLHILPDEVSDIQAVFVEPLASAFEILQQMEISSRDRVVVVGDGKLGLLVAMALQRTEARLNVIGRHEENLSIVRKRGINAVIETKSMGLDPANVVIDCSGSAEGFLTARKLVRPRGTLFLKSTFAAPVKVNLSSLVVDEITVIGSRCGPFQPALSALAQGEVDVSPLVSAVYSLEEGVAAFDKASAPGVLKVLLSAD